MKRSPLRRHAPLRADPEKTREFVQRGRKPVGRNAKRVRRRFQEAYHSKWFVLWVKSLACSVPGCERTDIECAHVGRPRSRGGKWWECAPLCKPHHRAQEKRTPAFNREHNIDLESIAAAVALRWKERTKAA